MLWKCITRMTPSHCCDRRWILSYVISKIFTVSLFSKSSQNIRCHWALITAWITSVLIKGNCTAAVNTTARSQSLSENQLSRIIVHNSSIRVCEKCKQLSNALKNVTRSVVNSFYRWLQPPPIVCGEIRKRIVGFLPMVTSVTSGGAVFRLGARRKFRLCTFA